MGRRSNWLTQIAFALALIGSISIAPQAFAETAAFQTSAPSAILIDSATGSTLFEKNADAPWAPASTVKLMTAELVFREIAEGRLKLDDEFTVSENAWRAGGALARGSTMFAAVHSRIRVEDLIRGLVVVSGNDAAIVLAEGVAGTESAFVKRMNERAAQLGFTHLSFGNVWGKDDPGQRVDAREMAMLADHIIKTYPALYRYFGEKEFAWGRIKQPNRNPLIPMNIGVDGLKTGNIDAASGYGIVASAVEDDQRLILAMYGARNAKERAEEARKMLQWGFRSFESRTVFKAGETVGSARLFGGAALSVPLVTEKEVRILTPRGSTERLTGQVVYDGPIAAPIDAGREIARVKISRGQTLAIDAPLQAAESVPQGPLYRRAFDSALELGHNLVTTYVFKK